MPRVTIALRAASIPSRGSHRPTRARARANRILRARSANAPGARPAVEKFRASSNFVPERNSLLDGDAIRSDRIFEFHTFRHRPSVVHCSHSTRTSAFRAFPTLLSRPRSTLDINLPLCPAPPLLIRPFPSLRREGNFLRIFPRYTRDQRLCRLSTLRSPFSCGNNFS